MTFPLLHFKSLYIRSFSTKLLLATYSLTSCFIFAGEHQRRYGYFLDEKKRRGEGFPPPALEYLAWVSCHVEYLSWSTCSIQLVISQHRGTGRKITGAQMFAVPAPCRIELGLMGSVRLILRLSKHALIQTFHGWQLCQKVVKTVRSDGSPSKAIPP